MPCFYLNFVGVEVTRDDEGHELPDLDSAIAVAVTGAREMIADLVVSGMALDLTHRIEIADANRRHLHSVRFADVVTFARTGCGDRSSSSAGAEGNW